MVKVLFDGNFVAEIEGGRWTSADKRLEAELNARMDPSGPSGADPDPDLTVARAAAHALGGEIIQADGEDEYEEDAIF